eukprot:scaffold255063_cov54-Attheya_sp.AAC.2
MVRYHSQRSDGTSQRHQLSNATGKNNNGPTKKSKAAARERAEKQAKADKQRANGAAASRASAAAANKSPPLDWHVVDNAGGNNHTIIHGFQDIRIAHELFEPANYSPLLPETNRIVTASLTSSEDELDDSADEEVLTMDERLQRQLEHLSVEESELPMDMGNFYETYFCSEQNGLDVRRSTYHNLSKWMHAMEEQELVVLKKHWQSDRKYRKRTASKVVVAVGREQVRKWKTHQDRHEQSLREGDYSEGVPSTSSCVDDVDLEAAVTSAAVANCEDGSQDHASSALDELVEQSEVSAPDSVVTANEMNDRLRMQLTSIVVDKDSLPIDSGNFYNKFIRTPDREQLDVCKSSYRSVSKWLHAMEKEGLVLLKKKHHNKRASQKVVVAVGKNQVLLVKRRHNASVVPTLDANAETESKDESVSIDDTDDGEESVNDSACYDHIHIRPTKHAKQRQHGRGITNTDIKRTIEDSKKPVRRHRDGMKEITADGVTAVVACGGKNKIITIWREEPNDGTYVKRWSNPGPVAVNSEYQVKDSKTIVTISETYQRYRKQGQRIGKNGRKVRARWNEGDVVRKNKKSRKQFVVVGLDEDSIIAVSKQIQNQAGCNVITGVLTHDDWYDIHGAEFDPLAIEGSQTIMFFLSSDNNMISRVLSRVETIVPKECRRYLREVKDGDLFLVEDVTNEKMPIIVDEKVRNEMYQDLFSLYKTHNPTKVSEVPDLLKKYHGREQALIHAVRRKYLVKAPVKPRSPAADVPSNGQKIKINVQDLLGVDDEEQTEELNTVPPNHYEMEDISSYF